LSFFSGVIVARVLGPQDYGNIYFLIGSFTSINTFVDMGASSAFYTFISKNKRGATFYSYYLGWVVFQFLLMVLVVIALFPDVLVQKVWLGHSRNVILLAFLASFSMSKLWKLARQIGESIRETVTVQLWSALLAISHLGLILLLAGFGCLSITIFFLLIVSEYVVFSLCLVARFKGKFIEKESPRVRPGEIFEEFKRYCAPLVVRIVAGALNAFLGRWFLQLFWGATQQGYFTISERFSSVILIATSSILSIFWKEVAEAEGEKNRERIKSLYLKVTRSLYVFGVAFCAILIPFTSEIINIFLGKEYSGAALPLAIMFLFPVHQSLSQITSIYLFATSKTKLHMQLGIITLLLGIPASYFIMAPTDAVIPGLGMGAVGLSLEMVLMQVITVNIAMFFIFRINNWSFDFWHQWYTLGIFLTLAFAIKFSISSFLSGYVLIVTCVLTYITFSAGIIYKFPMLAGFDETNSLKAFFNKLILKKGLI